MKKKIAVLPGDGIGPEVMQQALRVLALTGKLFGHNFVTTHGQVGGAAYEEFGTHMPDETLKLCGDSDAILFGSVGGPVAQLHLPKWKGCEANSILALRKAFHFNANLRPIKLYPELEGVCPLKSSVIGQGIDILFIRELLGDAYFGKKESVRVDGRRTASDLSTYTEDQVESVAVMAFSSARFRKKKVTSVDKANVLETSRLWRTVVREVAKRFPDVELEEMLVDNCAMQVILKPTQFDVVVTSNMFGDILTDEGAALAGSLGMLASASVNDSGFGLYEPPGGSAPDIAGKGVANPIAQILSCALMLRHSWGMFEEAAAIDTAVHDALKAGYRTADIHRKGDKLVSTVEMTEHILANLHAPAYAKV
jgi:3-isopropylmalate dehydrogenase